jgi:hypothetical protein
MKLTYFDSVTKQDVSVTAYLPFESHGHQFAVMRSPDALSEHAVWVTAHVETGHAIGKSRAFSRQESKQAAQALLALKTQAEIDKHVAKARKRNAAARKAAK